MKSARVKFFASTAIGLVFSISLFAQTEREKGIALYDEKNYKSAIEILEKTVSADDKDGIAWRFLGMAYANGNNNRRAYEAFEKAYKYSDEDLNGQYDTPVKFLKKPQPKYTEEALKNATSGKVILFVEFRRDGKVGDIFVFRKMPDGLNESAVEAARSITFKPAVKNGKEVGVIKFVVYTFVTS